MFAAVSAAADKYDYKTNNGENWKDIATTKTNECGKEGTQSPVDLPGWGKLANTYMAKDDNFNKMYFNQIPR